MSSSEANLSNCAPSVLPLLERSESIASSSAWRVACSELNEGQQPDQKDLTPLQRSDFAGQTRRARCV